LLDDIDLDDVDIDLDDVDLDLDEVGSSSHLRTGI
jgi:hypothetical protein